MPIYEYQCPKGHHFEEMQSFGAKPVASCPRCKLKAKRKISLAAFHLKGSGWYSKDAAASGKKKEKEKAKDEAPATESPTESSKPAETSAAEKPAKKEKTSREKKPVNAGAALDLVD